MRSLQRVFAWDHAPRGERRNRPCTSARAGAFCRPSLLPLAIELRGVPYGLANFPDRAHRCRRVGRSVGRLSADRPAQGSAGGDDRDLARTQGHDWRPAARRSAEARKAASQSSSWQQVTIANPEGMPVRDLFTGPTIKTTVELLPLLKGRVRMEELGARRAAARAGGRCGGQPQLGVRRHQPTLRRRRRCCCFGSRVRLHPAADDHDRQRCDQLSKLADGLEGRGERDHVRADARRRHGRADLERPAHRRATRR